MYRYPYSLFAYGYANQSQPHLETTSSRSEGGQSPTGNGNPAPATGHWARLVGDSGSESGPSHLMSSPDCRGQSGDHRHYLPAGHGARLGASVRSRRDLSASSPDRRDRSGYERQRHGNHGRKGDRQRVSSPGPSSGNRVSVLRHRSRSSKSDDRSSGTYYPTRDSRMKRRRHHSRHGHVSRRDVRDTRSRPSRTRDGTPRPDRPGFNPLSSDLLKVMREMQHTQTVLMARLEAHSNTPVEKAVSDTLCVDVERSDSFSSVEETPAESREWRPSVAVPKPAEEVTHEVVSDQHDDRPPSAGVVQASCVDTERASYQRTLNCVLQWNRLSVPVPQRETTFGGQLFQHCQEVIPEERHPALPQSELLSSAVRTVNNAIRGVAQFPLEEPGKTRDGAQSWGSHISLTSPPIPFYRPDYYKVWHAPEVVPEERVLTNKLWSVDAAALRSGGRPDGAACPVKIAQLRDWEAMIRASLGVLNHLDWFMSTVLVILGTGDLTSEKVAEVRNLLSSSGIALNHVSQIQARLLGSNATVRRESILAGSVLDKDTRQFLRDQPICLPELFGNKCGEALKVASEDRQKQFILKAALGGPFRSPPLPNSQGGQRFVQRREKGRTSYPPKPQGHTRLPKPSFPPRRPGRGRGRVKPSTAMAGRARPSV